MSSCKDRNYIVIYLNKCYENIPIYNIFINIVHRRQSFLISSDQIGRAVQVYDIEEVLNLNEHTQDFGNKTRPVFSDDRLASMFRFPVFIM